MTEAEPPGMWYVRRCQVKKRGLSNKSRKSKITPVRINSGRGEIVKIGLVRTAPSI